MKLNINGIWQEEIMFHDFPEHGPGALAVEDLYQSFKERLKKELCAERAVGGNTVERCPLADSE